MAAAGIALELALMRILAITFWSHLAYMVISVALLGFGASGTTLTLWHRRLVRTRQAWMWALALALLLASR